MKTTTEKETEGAIPSRNEIMTVPSRITGNGGGIEDLLAPATQIEAATLRRASLPPIVKPSQIAVGVQVTGTIIDVLPSPVATYKGELLLMRHPNGMEFAFPATAVVEKALRTELVRVKKAKNEKDAKLKDAVGITLLLRGLGKKNTADGLRSVNLFEVYFVEPKATK